MSSGTRFLFLSTLACLVSAAATGTAAVADNTLTVKQQSAVRKSADKALTFVESLQEDIVEELAGDKEKALFRSADQALSEFERFDKLMAENNSARDALYTQFDRVDARVAALVKSVSELSPKRPALTRVAERLRSQCDDLHFMLSAGDDSPERQRQVLTRQANSMKAGAKLFASEADYAISDRPGSAPFIDATRKYADRCGAFAKVAALGDLETCKREFSILTDSWKQLADGFLSLSSKEEYHIARLGFRLDEYHRRLFELLKMPGKRPILTIKL